MKNLPQSDPSYPDMNAIRERNNIAFYPPIAREPFMFRCDEYWIEIDFLGEVFTYHEGERSTRGICGRRYGFDIEPESISMWLPGKVLVTEEERSRIMDRVNKAAGY